MQQQAVSGLARLLEGVVVSKYAVYHVPCDFYPVCSFLLCPFVVLRNCAFQFQVLTRSCSTEQKACEEVNKQINLQRQSFKPCVGAAVPCREANTNYDQHDLNLGFLNKQDSADLCAQSCRDHAKKNPSAPCKFWTWIGPDADQPFLTLRNCWLKKHTAREGRFSQVGVISGGAAC